MKKSEDTTAKVSSASRTKDNAKVQTASNNKFTDKERKKQEAEKHNLGGF